MAGNHIMQITQEMYDRILQTYVNNNYLDIDVASWYAFIESVGLFEYDTRRARIIDPHIFLVACIRYAW